MNIEAFMSQPVDSIAQWQFLVGCLLGAGVGITLSRHGIMLTNPRTRWLFIALTFGFAGTFSLICRVING
ncbi:MAG: hypothetical protein DPW12_13050 [Rhodocyclaceae bacterium]|nr:hypothetical protein [Bacteroidia bacterium]MCQ3925092.1 hypothetical protein [Rhodocyclaceae bacterium]